MSLRAWLDETPGETRGVIARDGRYERLILHRESDAPEHRLGARLIGRVETVDPAIGAAFVDLGGPGPHGFLALKGPKPARVGDRIEVEVTAEPRGGKGPTLTLIGAGEGAPRLIAPGPDVAEWLRRWAFGVTPVTGLAAIQAGLEAEEEALATGEVFADHGVDIAVERTRALIAVDIDHHGAPGREARRSKAQANRFALMQAARLIRLKAWGGLAAIDLVGSGHDGAALGAVARTAFAPDGEVAIGPVSRFGLLQLSLPWRRAPIEEILRGADGRATPETRALAAVRMLHQALLSDTTAARLTLRACPDDATLAAPLVARLGPRAHMLADPAMAPGRFGWHEG